MLLAADDFYRYVGTSMSAEYATKLRSIMQTWVFPLVFVGAFAGGWIGAYIGRSATKKHFRKAGVINR